MIHYWVWFLVIWLQLPYSLTCSFIFHWSIVKYSIFSKFQYNGFINYFGSWHELFKRNSYQISLNLPFYLTHFCKRGQTSYSGLKNYSIQKSTGATAIHYIKYALIFTSICILVFNLAHPDYLRLPYIQSCHRFKINILQL